MEKRRLQRLQTAEYAFIVTGPAADGDPAASSTARSRAFERGSLGPATASALARRAGGVRARRDVAR